MQGCKVLPQVEEFKCLGVLFKSGARIGEKINRQIGASSVVMESYLLGRYGEERAAPKGKTHFTCGMAMV